jgi:isoleucyl-tRNA synthetase
MKEVAKYLTGLSQTEIARLEQTGELQFEFDGQTATVLLSEVEIISEDVPGWLVANDENLTVALDTTITEELEMEGLARELVNKIQTFRKESDFDVTDKIVVHIKQFDKLAGILDKHKDYIATQTLANTIEMKEDISQNKGTLVRLSEDIETIISISKH